MSKYRSESMGKYWLMGFIGSLMIIAGFVTFLLIFPVSCVNAIGGGAGGGNSPTEEIMFVFSVALGAGGSYLRYLSRQAVFDPTTSSTSANVSVAVAPVVSSGLDVGEKAQRKDYIGEKNLEIDAYKIFLVENFNIKKNDVLDGYIFDEKIYASLDSALAAADAKYRQK